MNDNDDALRLIFKNQLREQMRTVRNALPAAAAQERSRALAHRVLTLPQYQRASTILSYLPINNELDPRFVIEDARRERKRIVLPRIESDDLALKLWCEGDSLEQNGYGISEPMESAPTLSAEEIDFAIIPALAVDERGHRIGYGKGFFDRLLVTLTNAFTLAVIFDFQLVAEVPDLPHDVAVDAIATDTRMVVRKSV